MLAVDALPAPVQRQVSARLSRGDLGRWLGQVEQVGHCARPIRVAGRSETINRVTGEVVGTYASSSEPDRVTYLRCNNRRRAVCPSCSHQYQGDVFHVIMAGAAGGMKDVPAEVAGHPLIFATLTAPSFGPVHTAKKPGRGGSRRCRPRSGEGRQLCPHGRPRWCMAIHDHTDNQVGQPLCADCYDYAGHAVWQWHGPELWRRFTIKLWRGIAGHLGVSETACKTAPTRVGTVGSTCSATAAISPRTHGGTRPPWAGSARPVATTPAANTSSNAQPRLSDGPIRTRRPTGTTPRW